MVMIVWKRGERGKKEFRTGAGQKGKSGAQVLSFGSYWKMGYVIIIIEKNHQLVKFSSS